MKVEKNQIAKPRQLNAKWTVELQHGESSFREGLEEELAEVMRAEIDWEVFSGLMKELGWITVTLTNNNNWAIYDWVQQNCKGKHKHRNNIWIFELKEDAEWFTLRWS